VLGHRLLERGQRPVEVSAADVHLLQRGEHLGGEPCQTGSTGPAWAVLEEEADEGVLEGVGAGEGVGLVLVEVVGAVVVDEAVQAVG
jgi:hypothetical protein